MLGFLRLLELSLLNRVFYNRLLKLFSCFCPYKMAWKFNVFGCSWVFSEMALKLHFIGAWVTFYFRKITLTVILFYWLIGAYFIGSANLILRSISMGFRFHSYSYVRLLELSLLAHWSLFYWLS